jgi:dehydrogenase/reductase SDR family member 12
MAHLLDTLLDRTVVVGYTTAGFRLRRRWWDPADLRAMDGELALVTGATSGLGRAAAEGFARLGARVLLVVRDAERGERARAEVLEHTGAEAGDVTVALCDLASLADVRRFAAELTAREPRVDVLVNNAGALPPRRTLSPDGNELTLATNVLGPHLLTRLLLEPLAQGAPGRVINVSSGGMYTQKLDVSDLQSAAGEFSGSKAYAKSKRAEVVLTEQWAQRIDPDRTVFHAMHPGWADTPGLAESLPGFHRLTKPVLRDADEGADTIVWLGAAPAPARTSGGFWHDRAQRPTYYLPWTQECEADRERLWRACAELTGWDAEA